MNRRSPASTRKVSRKHHAVGHLVIGQILSGGQTGVDRGALDAAIELGISHGGACPRGRRAEDGIIPRQYQLWETQSRNYKVRTEQNVLDAGATLILIRDKLTGGTALTADYAQRHQKPCLVVRAIDEPDPNAVGDWLGRQKTMILNVAGPRATHWPEGHEFARRFLLAALGGCGGGKR